MIICHKARIDAGSLRFCSAGTKKPALGRFLGKYRMGSDLRDMVGATGFEPATFSSRTRRATKLRYAPMNGAHCTEKVLPHKGLAGEFWALSRLS